MSAKVPGVLEGNYEIHHMKLGSNVRSKNQMNEVSGKNGCCGRVKGFQIFSFPCQILICSV